MADAATKKVFISVDSEDSQQESIKTSRRKFGVIQKDATDKENLVGRQHALLNAKLQLESTPKQRKATLVHQHSQTVECGPSRVTEDDLTSLEEPSEKYWESLAETRRRALEDSLCENEALHNRVRSLESELDVTNEMLEHARSLVEVLKEMLEENEAEKEGAQGDEEEEVDDKEEETVTNTPPTSAEKVDPVNEGEEGQEEGEEADQE